MCEEDRMYWEILLYSGMCALSVCVCERLHWLCGTAVTSFVQVQGLSVAIWCMDDLSAAQLKKYFSGEKCVKRKHLQYPWQSSELPILLTYGLQSWKYKSKGGKYEKSGTEARVCRVTLIRKAFCHGERILVFADAFRALRWHRWWTRCILLSPVRFRRPRVQAHSPRRVTRPLCGSPPPDRPSPRCWPGVYCALSSLGSRCQGQPRARGLLLTLREKGHLHRSKAFCSWGKDASWPATGSGHYLHITNITEGVNALVLTSQSLRRGHKPWLGRLTMTICGCKYAPVRSGNVMWRVSDVFFSSVIVQPPKKRFRP